MAENSALVEMQPPTANACEHQTTIPGFERRKGRGGIELDIGSLQMISNCEKIWAGAAEFDGEEEMVAVDRRGGGARRKPPWSISYRRRKPLHYVNRTTSSLDSISQFVDEIRNKQFEANMRELL